MVINFVGAAGAGKSTITREARQRLRNEGVRVASSAVGRRNPVWIRCRLVAHLRAVKFANCLSVEKHEGRRKLIGKLARSQASLLALKRRNGIVLTQGMTRELWTHLCRFERPFHQWRSAFSVLYFPDAVVCISAPSEVRSERRAGRNKRVRPHAKPRLKRFLKKMRLPGSTVPLPEPHRDEDRALHDLSELLREMQVPVVSIDSCMSVSYNVERIVYYCKMAMGGDGSGEDLSVVGSQETRE